MPIAFRIRKILPDRTILTVAGTGELAYSGDTGPATKAALSDPIDIAFDKSNNLYIADHSNSVIRRVTSGGIITTDLPQKPSCTARKASL